MTRLPSVGGDKGTWGDILNDFLSQSLAADGTLKSGAVGSAQLAPGAVTSAKLKDGSVTADKLADGVAAIGPQGPPGPAGTDGRTPVVEFRSFGGQVQQRTDSGAWQDIVSLATITGPSGSAATVTLVPAALWPPAADADPLHLYVKVPDA